MRDTAISDRAAAADSCDVDGVPACLTREMWEHAVAVLRLPPQEARIVGLIMRKFQDKEIATAMGLRRCTIRTYLTRIFDRLGVDSRAGVMSRVFELCVGKEYDMALPQVA